MGYHQKLFRFHLNEFGIGSSDDGVEVSREFSGRAVGIRTQYVWEVSVKVPPCVRS